MPEYWYIERVENETIEDKMIVLTDKYTQRLSVHTLARVSQKEAFQPAGRNVDIDLPASWTLEPSD